MDALLAQFPADPARLLRRLACLRDAPREERLVFLRKTCTSKEADPALMIELARALSGDARCLPEARRWLKQAARFRPFDTSAITAQADLCWEEGSLEEATELYRFAADLEGYHEGLFQSWFIACRKTHRTSEAIEHLDDRFARFGARSEQPALTLAWAWRELEQPAQAREILREAARLRPDDGPLLLRSASLLASLGEHDEAERLLNLARTKVRENDWLRTAAEVADYRLDTDAGLHWAKELLRIEPCALDAHGRVARCLASLEGIAAALNHLASALNQNPNHCGLLRMRIEWSRGSGAVAVQAAARELLLVDPADAWARRELAMALRLLNRNEDALREADEAARIEPRNAYCYSVRGHILKQLGQLREARAQFRRAVELSVDNSDALHALLELAGADQDRVAELEFIERELVRQVVQGDGLLAFLELARPIIEPGALLEKLREAHRARPDLWHTWAALVAQLGHLGHVDEAFQTANDAVQRFPHLPRLWLDLASAHQWRKEPEEEIKAAERAFELNPAWNRAAVTLASALERCGRMEEARTVYERALRHSGEDAQLNAFYAHLLWRLRQSDEAFAAIERALRLAPGYEWAWGLLIDWAHSYGAIERPGRFARALAQEQPGETRAWIMLARVLNGPGTRAERLEAVEKALTLDPRSSEIWDYKAELLAEAEQFEDAIKACQDGAAVCAIDVHILRGRQAWIEAQRGHLPEAIALMRAVLEENASYAWGWSLLSQWLIQQDAIVDASAALEQLLRLRPHDAWVHRQLGFLRLKQDDRNGAQQAFANALLNAPTDVAAAHNIFDLQLRSDDLDGALATLQMMQTHQPGARTMTAEIFLRLRERKKHAALGVLQKLCALPDPDGWPVEAAVDAFKNAGLARHTLKVLRRALRQPVVNPQVGAAATGLLLDRKMACRAVWLFLRLPPGEARRRAAAPLVQGLAALNSKLLFRFLLLKARQELVGDDDAWGQVGYAFNRFNRPSDTIRWMSDWRSRENVQPWMLFNLCLSLRQLGDCEEANAIALRTLEYLEHRDGANDMRLFLAVEDALAGEAARAGEHLRQVVVRSENHYDQQMIALANALLEFRQGAADPSPERFKSIRKKLAKPFTAWRLLGAGKDVRRTFRRAQAVFVNEGAGWQVRLWFAWKLHWQWLLAPVVLALATQPTFWLGILLYYLVRLFRR